MDSKISATEKTQSSEVESTEQSKTLTAACATIEDEAQEILSERQDNIGKPKTLTEACVTMKAESIDEAKRLIPNKQ